MDPHIYPDPQTAPLNVPAKVGRMFGSSGLVAIEENSAIDPISGLRTMWIRIAKVGSGCMPPGGSKPMIWLTAGGDQAQVPIGSTVSIWNESGAPGPEVANAIMLVEANGVYLVKVFLFATGSTWQMRIGNDDTEPRDFTWVVASTDTLSRRPWIDLPTTLVFNVATGRSVSKTISVANKGTGSLTIGDTVGTSLGPGFTLTTVPGSVPPNNCRGLTITFVGSSASGASNATYTVANLNDTTAQATAGHNKRVSLSATTTVSLPPPSFAHSPDQFQPKDGVVGQTVLLFGDNFNVGSVKVQFAGANAPVISATATQIVTSVPAGLGGLPGITLVGVVITVTTDGGSVESDDPFTVLPPLPPVPSFVLSPDQFSPKIGVIDQNVKLFGDHFDIDPVQVQFGSVDATILSITATQIEAKVPSGVTSAVKITVTTGGGSVVSDDHFIVLPPLPSFAPSPNQFTPKFGAPGQNVTLIGTHFDVGTAQVNFDGVEASVISATSTEIETRVPSLLPETVLDTTIISVVKIGVVTSGGSVVSDDTFTVRVEGIPTIPDNVKGIPEIPDDVKHLQDSLESDPPDSKDGPDVSWTDE